MAIKNDDPDPITHHFLKTFFRLEKVNAVIPNTEETTPVLILFDCGSGKTVGNYVESLDGYEQMKTTNIVLSSLNGDDSTQKRVCQVTILGHDGKQFPLDVIIPKEEIPKPAPQSMECFMKKETKKVKNSYIDKITQQDIDTLPLILLGVNYQKLFPDPEKPCKRIADKSPNIGFFRSQFSNKLLVSGVKEVESPQEIVNNVHYRYNEVFEDNRDFSAPPIKVEFSPSQDIDDSQVERVLKGIDISNLDEIEQAVFQNKLTSLSETNEDNSTKFLDDDDTKAIKKVLCQDLQEHCGTDRATFDLINMLKFSDQIHDGKDEETISLVNQLKSKDNENEVSQNNKVPDNNTDVNQLNKVPSKTNKKKKVNKVANHTNLNSSSSDPKKENEE